MPLSRRRDAKIQKTWLIRKAYLEGTDIPVEMLSFNEWVTSKLPPVVEPDEKTPPEEIRVLKKNGLDPKTLEAVPEG